MPIGPIRVSPYRLRYARGMRLGRGWIASAAALALACGDNLPRSEDGACDSLGVVCSGRGVCVEDDGAPRCECEPGFVDHGGNACGAPVREGPCSADGWCVVSPLPLAEVAGLWSAGPDEVWGFGGGDVARRRGGVWTRLDFGIDAPILTIDGTGPDDVWLLTSEQLFHFDGQSVVEVPVACRLSADDPAELRSLSALAVAGSGEVFVTGAPAIDGSAEPAAGTCRFDGDAWHPLELDGAITPCAVTGLGLEEGQGVWTVGADHVWCGRDSLWDGDALHRVEGAPPAPTYDVWGSGPDDVWVASGTLWHWDGAAWSDTGIYNMWSIDGAAPDDVWAAGLEVLHWDGADWTVIDSSAFVGLVAVAAAGAGEASVADAGEYNYASPELFRYTAEGRTDEMTRLSIVPGTMWGARSDELWLGGYAERDGGLWPVGALAVGGETWTSVEMPPLARVTDLLGFGADDVWGIGYVEPAKIEDPTDSYLLQYDGAWTLTPADDLDLGVAVNRRGLHTISGSSSSDLWFGGTETGVDNVNRGFVAHWDGSTWTHVVAERPSTMWGLGEDVWIATLTDLQRWDGASWESFPLPDETYVGAITGFATDDVWAAGSNGLLLHWDGASWQSVASGTTATLTSLWGTGPDDLWASGGAGSVGGTVLHWDGATWSPEALPSRDVVTTVFGVDGDLWALSRYLMRRGGDR